MSAQQEESYTTESSTENSVPTSENLSMNTLPPLAPLPNDDILSSIPPILPPPPLLLPPPLLPPPLLLPPPFVPPPMLLRAPKLPRPFLPFPDENILSKMSPSEQFMYGYHLGWVSRIYQPLKLNLKVHLDLRQRPFSRLKGTCPYTKSDQGLSIATIMTLHQVVDIWDRIESLDYDFGKFRTASIMRMISKGSKEEYVEFTPEISKMNKADLQNTLKEIKDRYILKWSVPQESLVLFDCAVVDSSIHEKHFQDHMYTWRAIEQMLPEIHRPHKLEGSDQYTGEEEVYNIAISDTMIAEVKPYELRCPWKLYNLETGVTIPQTYAIKRTMIDKLKGAPTDFSFWQINWTNLMCDLRFISLTKHLWESGRRPILVTGDKVQAYICTLLNINFHYIVPP